MRVLFLAPELPFPATSGARIRNLNLVRGLAERHDVTLLAFGDGAEAPSPDAIPDALRALCRSVEVVGRPFRTARRRLLDQFRPEPDLARRLLSPSLAGRARDLVDREPFDAVHVGGLEMAEAGFALRDRAAVIFDEHNAEYVLQRRAFENECRLGGNPVGAAYSLLQWLKLKSYEAHACRAADGVMAVSEVDRDALLRLTRARIAVLPNSVDVREYEPRTSPVDGPATVLFTGKMDFRPNVDAAVWFCESVWPLVRAQVPDARFQIVGRSPAPRVARLAERPGVEVTGAVPDDRPYVARARAFVVPMRVGGGVRIKVLQAMAAGVPIVSTTVGYEGVSAIPGEHLLVADEPAEFAGAVVRLLSSPEAGLDFARRGRSFVEATYDWRVLAPRLRAFYEETVASRSSTR